MNRYILTVMAGMAALGLFSASCAGGAANKGIGEVSDVPGYLLPFPPSETWYLTSGPHTDNATNVVRNGIDIAPTEGGDCPAGKRVSKDNRFVTASASGQVIIVGNDNDRSDPNHSIVKVKDGKGLTQVYMHLDHITVKVGDKVTAGKSQLGNPSCEFPPGGGNTGPHVHFALEKDGQPQAIDKFVLSGWTIHARGNNNDGTMTREGETTRTSDVGRCGPTEDSIKACGGIRNDLTNVPPPQKQVLGATTTPTSKPIQAETGKPAGLEQQARAAAVEHFLYSLYTPRSETLNDWPLPRKADLTPSILNRKLVDGQLDGFPVNEIVRGIQVADSVFLLLTWTYVVESRAECMPWPTRPWLDSPYDKGKPYPPAPKTFMKNVGEGEIRSIKLSSVSSPLTDGDRANGVQWRGQVGMNYIVRWRFVIPYFAFDNYDGTRKVYCASISDEEWAKAKVAVEPSGPFTDWSDSGTSFTLELRNGQWNVSDCYLGIGCGAWSYPISAARFVGSEGQNPCLSRNGPQLPGCQPLVVGASSK